ncbi:MAG: Ldh family oxidoreductase [Alphaproteobacteria bacterium]|nr:Ldh family oxidoreductase [Alphaproteobacteria bacterium]
MTAETKRLPTADVHALIRSALERSNVSTGNAGSVANALLAAELTGQSGHGLRRVASYSAQAARGKVDGHAHPHLEPKKPGAALVDAANGFAYPALDLALDWLPQAARSQGIAIAGITRSHHCGVAGVIVEAMAEQGLIGLLFANTPAAMAPWGASKAILGTNPIAFAVPVPGSDPITIDISLSKVARGKVMAARQQKQPIPEGWALDSKGQPTTDPEAAINGTMAPMGDAKGTVLALMVELLSAGLTGAHYSFEQSSFLNADGPPPGSGQTLIAIDPAAFGAHALPRFAVMADMIAQMDGARVPGHRRQTLKREYQSSGIVVDVNLIADIEAIGR